jgi:hypothetical protein
MRPGAFGAWTILLFSWLLIVPLRPLASEMQQVLVGGASAAEVSASKPVTTPRVNIASSPPDPRTRHLGSCRFQKAA